MNDRLNDPLNYRNLIQQQQIQDRTPVPPMDALAQNQLIEPRLSPAKVPMHYHPTQTLVSDGNKIQSQYA